MLDGNEGSGKDQFLGDPDWLSEMQYNTIKSAICGLLEPVPSFSSGMRSKKFEKALGTRLTLWLITAPAQKDDGVIDF